MRENVQIRCKNKLVINYSVVHIIGFLLLFFILGYSVTYPDTVKDISNNNTFRKIHLGLATDFNYSDNPYNSSQMDIKRLSDYIPEQKDPFVAGFLSWLMMGVGQIYCKEYTRGSIFIALDLLDKGALIAITSYLNRKYSPKGEEIININWSTFDSSTKLLIISYVIAKYSIRFYNVYDAIQAAKNYNKMHFLSRGKSGVSFNIDPNALRLGYSLEFK